MRKRGNASRIFFIVISVLLLISMLMGFIISLLPAIY
jgi:hypothetical protein